MKSCGGPSAFCQVCPLKVRTVTADSVSPDLLREDHTVGILETPAALGVIGPGGMAPVDWDAGTTAFFPAGVGLIRPEGVEFRETLMSIGSQRFADAVRGDVDLSRLDMRFTVLTGPVSLPMVASVRAMAESGACRNWPLLVESSWVALTGAVIMSLATVAGRRPASGMNSARKVRVTDYVEANIGRQITVAELSDVAAMSRFHFTRSFKLSFGVSPLHYLAHRRVGLAKLLLRGGRSPLVDVAALAGFCSQAHMTTVFQRVLGVTPGEYRRKA